MCAATARDLRVAWDELLAFVRPRHHGILATERADRSPQLSPVTMGVDGPGRHEGRGPGTRFHGDDPRAPDVELLGQLILMLVAHVFGHAARTFSQLVRRSSGRTRVSATVVMKFVSPLQRGSTCMWM